MLEWVRLLALIVLLLIATLWDIRAQRIPNWLTLGGWATGVLLAVVTAATGGEAGPLFLGMFLAGGALLLFYLGGGLGGGDVKLALGVGVLAGYPDVVRYLFFGLLAGLALILGKLAWRGETRHELSRLTKSKPHLLRPGAPDKTPEGDTPSRATTSFALAWSIGVLWVWLMERL